MKIISIAKVRIPKISLIWIAGTTEKILRIELSGSRHALLNGLGKDIKIVEDARPFRTLIRKLCNYASGKRVNFDEALDLSGTTFQRAVWRAISKIPYGETRSYAWLAKTAGRPRAIRAAANACGTNSVPIIIPCHRVIASDGTLGGFSGRLALKKKFLAIEGIKDPSTGSSISKKTLRRPSLQELQRPEDQF